MKPRAILLGAALAARAAAPLIGLLAVAAGACTPPDQGPVPVGPDEGPWAGTVTTDGSVTTVVNESGSVWGRPATLVEEASFGVESGDPAYMFGYVGGLYASDDEIYVLDSQALELRVFDLEGNHLGTLGGRGQGPGEFTRPCYVTGMPDGRIFVIAAGNGRINVYGSDGASLPPWKLPLPVCENPFMPGPDGTLWVHTYDRDRELAAAIQAIGADGLVGDTWPVPDLDYQRWTLRFDGREFETVPFAPHRVWRILPGAMVVGASDRYRFEIRYPDGARTVVERYWEPVPVSEMERDYGRAYQRARYSRGSLEWDGDIPDHKPAFESFIPTYSNQVWVRRELAAEPIPGCDPTASEQTELGLRPRRCHRAGRVIDAFELEGRYLGEVEEPGGRPLLTFLNTYIRDEMVLAWTTNDAGTIVIKRYRLVPPGTAHDGPQAARSTVDDR